MKYLFRYRFTISLLIFTILLVQSGCSLFTPKKIPEPEAQPTVKEQEKVPEPEVQPTVKDKVQPKVTTKSTDERQLPSGMKMVLIKGGTFDMGDTFGNGGEDEKPAHTIKVDSFYLSETEVTVGQYREFAKATGYKTEAEKTGGVLFWGGSVWEQKNGTYWDNLGFSQSESHPVAGISWNDAVAYVDWLTKKTGKKYRLPTEAEWEYAAREGGKKIKYSWGNSEPDGTNCNYADSNTDFDWSDKKHNDRYKITAPVKSYKPNSLGLYEMSGNLWEWCSDWYGRQYYKNSTKDNPKGPLSGKSRVLRGGSWFNKPELIRCIYRGMHRPGIGYSNIGFRVAR
ncbi:MAG: SUMF1/EgtB/PvdO family nonheme iron enzyme [Candidatus Schekmanbacteria bacterium]|nr:SUMF1/EgtB/PvdO family nonheme iron enzyme [Candidatus Schekmanbacteria bacterium]